MRTIYHITGLPRSGSTLLTNVLVQNPKFHSTATSSFLDLLLQLRDNWKNLEGHKAFPDGQDRWDVIRAVSQSYHKTNKRIIFDKNRGWTNHIELAEKISGKKAKLIACVRDMSDICASFEKLFRDNRGEDEIHGEFNNPKMRTLDSRIELWTSDEGVIGRPYVSLVDAYKRGLGDRIFILPYEEWTSQPETWFRKMYEFLEEPYFNHDFQNVEQFIRENDAGYGWGDNLHEIKTGPVKPIKSRALEMLGENWVNKLKNSEFWKPQS
jgi:sulfotransferase